MTDFIEIKVRSSIDASEEPSLLFLPDGNGPFPLVVGLHTWSFDRFNLKGLIEHAKKRGYALLLPEFRGPNLVSNPRAWQACGSVLAQQDIIDATEFVLKNYPIRSDLVFLLGGSGGAHMGLLTAAFRPDLWRAVEVWCPITDVAEWHRYYGTGNGYAPHMEACCGGLPSDCPAEYAARSPISCLDNLAKVRYLSVKHGRYDKSVPYTHTLKLATALDALKPEAFFFEIFDGAHDTVYIESFKLFESICDGKTKKMDRITS